MISESEKYYKDLGSLKDKIETYETLFHYIHLYRDVTHDEFRLNRTLDIISEWSKAHRSVQNESEDVRQSKINEYFLNFQGNRR